LERCILRALAAQSESKNQSITQLTTNGLTLNSPVISW